MSIARNFCPWMGVALLAAPLTSCSKTGISGSKTSNKVERRVSPTLQERPADKSVKVGLVGADEASVQRANASARQFEPDDLNAKIARQSASHSSTPTSTPQAWVEPAPLRNEVLSSSDSRVEPVAPVTPEPVTTIASPPPIPHVPEPVKVETPASVAPPAEAVAQQSPVAKPTPVAEPTPVIEAKVEPAEPASTPIVVAGSTEDTVRDVEPASPPEPIKEAPTVAATPTEPPPVAVAEQTAPSPCVEKPTMPPVPVSSPVPAPVPEPVAKLAEPTPTVTPPPIAAAPAANPAPSVQAPAAAAPREKSLTSLIHDLEATVGRQPNDLEQQLRLRMLYAVLGDEDKALAATPGMSGDSAEMVRGLVRPMIEICKDANRDPAACATRQLAAVEELRQFLRTRADLTIPRLLLCRSVDGFDRFDAIDPPRVPARAPVTCQLYVEIDNFTSQRTPANEYRTSISMRTSLLSKSGRELWSTVDDKIDDIARQPRRDFFVAKEVSFPDTLPAGDYIIKVDVEDKLGGKVSTRSLGLKVVGSTVKAASADASQP